MTATDPATRLAIAVYRADHPRLDVHVARLRQCPELLALAEHDIDAAVTLITRDATTHLHAIAAMAGAGVAREAA